MGQPDKQRLRETTKASSSVMLGAAAASDSVQGSSQRQEKHQSAAFGTPQSPHRAGQGGSAQPPDEPQSIQPRPDSQRGVDELTFISQGLKLIVINDRDSNFLPIMSLNSSPCQIQAYMHSQQSTI